MWCVFFWFPNYQGGKFVIKSWNLLCLQIGRDVASGSGLSYQYSLWVTSRNDLTQTANNFRFSTNILSRCVLGACIIIQTEIVSCCTNGQKTLNLPEIGLSLFEVPTCGSGLQNVRFCVQNILQSTVMKQQGWIDIVVIHHFWKRTPSPRLSGRNSHRWKL